MTRTVLRLVFGTADGNTHTIEFLNPKSDITQTQVHDLMQMIITKNAILSKYGDLTSIKDGGIVTTTITDLVP
jgi:hypothetical protein